MAGRGSIRARSVNGWEGGGGNGRHGGGNTLPCLNEVVECCGAGSENRQYRQHRHFGLWRAAGEATDAGDDASGYGSTREGVEAAANEDSRRGEHWCGTFEIASLKVV
jgi:hypothetical protein